MKCSVCQRRFETGLERLWVIQWNDVNVCHDCTRWLNGLTREHLDDDTKRSLMNHIDAAYNRSFDALQVTSTQRGTAFNVAYNLIWAANHLLAAAYEATSEGCNGNSLANRNWHYINEETKLSTEYALRAASYQEKQK